VTTGAISVLRDFLRASQISPPMIQGMIEGIQQWLTDGNEPYDFSAHSPGAHLHLVHLAYMNQSSIGWGNLLRGRIATAWLQAHDQYYSLRHLHDKYSTTHFAPALVRHLWDFSLAIWQHRNDEIHGATNDAATDKQEKTLGAKITAVYQQPEEHSDANRLVLLTKSLPDRLKTRYASKVKWLSLRSPCTSSKHQIHQQTHHLPHHAPCTICSALLPLLWATQPPLLYHHHLPIHHSHP
jgi:hypothetical protein